MIVLPTMLTKNGVVFFSWGGGGVSKVSEFSLQRIQI